MSELIQTPSQTVGPFFAIGLPWEDGPDVVPNNTPGSFWIRGAVFDGNGAPVPDALVETWQADPAFRGFARCLTDAEGRWEILTLKPGRVEGQAPHVAVSIFARGLLRHLVTRVYFPGEAETNAADPVLSGLGERARASLIAAPDGRFDIHLQGPHETTFFRLV